MTSGRRRGADLEECSLADTLRSAHLEQDAAAADSLTVDHLSAAGRASPAFSSVSSPRLPCAAACALQRASTIARETACAPRNQCIIRYINWVAPGMKPEP